jgi:hypothetical protein
MGVVAELLFPMAEYLPYALIQFPIQFPFSVVEAI